MASSTYDGINDIYAYSEVGQRVKITNATSSVATIYPTSLYNETRNGSGTTIAQTDHLFADDLTLATMASTTATSTLTYHLTDHLGSVTASTNTGGNVIEQTEYNPYGSVLSNTTTGTAEQRQYIGQEYDANTALSYLNARYYDGNRGQFLSQDPMFWSEKQNLQSPQSLNSYSYAENNPIVNKDPSGKCIWDGCVVEAAATLGFASGIGMQAYSDYQTGAFSQRSIGENIAAYALAGTGGAVITAGGALVGVQAAGLSLLARLGLSGLTSGLLTAGTEVVSNQLQGKTTDPSGVAIDSLIAAGSEATFGLLPGVRGALPKSYTSAINMFSKSHAARMGAETAVGASMSILGSTIYQSFNNSGSVSGYSTPAVAKSLGIGNSMGNFVGTYDFGAGIGKIDFSGNKK